MVKNKFCTIFFLYCYAVRNKRVGGLKPKNLNRICCTFIWYSRVYVLWCSPPIVCPFKVTWMLEISFECKPISLLICTLHFLKIKDPNLLKRNQILLLLLGIQGCIVFQSTFSSFICWLRTYSTWHGLVITKLSSAIFTSSHVI